MAQRLNKNLVVGLTIAGMAVIAGAGVLLVYSLPGRDPGPVADQARQLVEKAKKADEEIKAANEQTNTLADGPEKAAVLEKIGKLQTERDENYTTAGKYYGKAAARALAAGDRAKSNEYMVSAGEMALNAGEQRVAMECWRRVLLNNPQHEMAQQKIVELTLEQAELYGQQWWREVQKEAERLCEITQSANLIGLHALGRALIEPATASKEDLKKGQEVLEKAFARDETNPKFAMTLSTYHLRTYERAMAQAREKGEPTEPIEATKDEIVARALAVQDRLIAALEKNPPKDTTVVATAWRQRGQLEMAIREGLQREWQFKQAQGATPTELEILRKKIKTHSDASLADMEKALTVEPNSDETLVLMGAYWRSMDSTAADPAEKKAELDGYTAKAKQLYEKAVMANQDGFDAYMQLQDIYTRQADAAFARQDKADMQANFRKADQVLEERVKRGISRTGVYSWRNKSYMSVLRWQLFQLNAAAVERFRQMAGGPANEETKPLLDRMQNIRRDFVAEAVSGEKDPRALFMKARVEMLNSKPYDAISTLRELQDLLDPGELWVRTKLHLAELCLQIDEPGPAMEALQTVIKSYPNLDSAVALLARVLASVPGRDTEAEAYAKRALALNQDNRDAWVVLAQVYQRQKNWRQLEEIRKRLSGGTDSQAARIQEATLMLARAQDPASDDAQLRTSAQGMLREVLKDDPSNLQALRALAASIGTDEGNRAEIMDALAKAKADVQKKLKDAAASTQPADKEQLTNLQKSIEYLELIGDPKITDDERRDRVAQMLRDSKDPFTSEVSLYRLYVGVPGKEADALQHLKAAYKLKPDDPGVVEMMFRAAISTFKDSSGNEVIKPDWTLAQEMVKRAVDLGIDRAGGHYYQGQLLFARTDLKDNYIQAEKEFREGLKAFPLHSNGYAWLGRTLLQENRIEDAQAAFEQSFNQNPRNGMAAMHLAIIADGRGDNEAKLRYLGVCRDLGVSTAWVQAQLQILQDNEDPQKGIARREKIHADLTAQKKPQDYENLQQLANLYQRVNQPEKVQAILAECFELRPKDLAFVQRYATYLMNLEKPELEKADAVLHKCLDSFGADEKEDKAVAQLLIATHMEMLAARKLPNAEKAPKEADVEAAFMAAVATSDKPRILRDVAQHYKRMNNGAKTEEWLHKCIDNAVRDGLTNDERQAREALLETLLQTRDLKRAPEVQKEVEAYRAKFKDPAGLLAMSEWASMVGRETKAIQSANEFLAVATGQDRALGFFRRGIMNLRRGDWDLAINDFREAKVLTASGFNYEHRILLARCLQITGQSDQAIAELSSILKEDPKMMRAVQELFRIYMAAKKYDEAEAFIMPANQLDPKNPLWSGLLAEVASARGDYARAIQRTMQTAQNTNYAPKMLDDLLRLYMKYKRYDEMMEFINSKLPEDKRGTPLTLLRLAEMHAAKGDNAKASELYGQAMKSGLEVEPLLVAAVLSFDECLAKDATLDFVRREASARPDDLVAQVMLAQLLRDRKQPDEVLKISGSLLARIPNEPKYVQMRLDTLQGIADSNYRLKRFDEARKAYEEVIKIAPQGHLVRPIAMNNLAYLLVEDVKDPAAGLPYAEQANQLMPGQSNILDTLGWALVLQGQYDRGIATIRQGVYAANTLDLSQMAAVHYHAAMGLIRRSQDAQKRGESTNAEQDLTEARLDCRRAQELLFAHGSDDDGLLPKVVEVGKQLGLTLPDKMPAASQPAAAH